MAILDCLIFISGFKVVSHMMPDLPNVGFQRDIEQFVVRNSWASFLNICPSNCF